MKKKHLLLLSTTIFVSVLITFFASCSDDDGLPSDPIKWTSGTHSIKMADKYNHQVFIDANADTLQFECVNYSYPYITNLTEPDTAFEYRIGISSDADIPEKASYYFMDTHEQHIDRPNLKVELKDNILTVVVGKNTSQNQRVYGLTFVNSEGGFPSLGFISVFQAGIKP